MACNILERHRVSIDIERANGAILSILFELFLEELGKVGRCFPCVSVDQPKDIGRYQPSEPIDAPESLKTSDPIWIGKTFSYGRIQSEMFLASVMTPCLDAETEGPACWLGGGC